MDLDLISKRTLIIDSGESTDITSKTGRSHVNVTELSDNANTLENFTVTLDEPMTIKSKNNIFIDNITLSSSRPQQDTTINVSDETEPSANTIATLFTTEGPAMTLEIIGITTSTGMETNPFVNAVDPTKLDLQKKFTFSNSNNSAVKGMVESTGDNLNVHTFTNAKLDYVSTINASPENPKKITAIEFKLLYSWAGNPNNFVFNNNTEAYSSKNRAIIEFLFVPV